MLKKDGWILDRTKGGHRQFRHSVKKGTVTVAGHPGADVKPGTVNNIKGRAGLE